jgi:hypothetical protein
MHYLFGYSEVWWGWELIVCLLGYLFAPVSYFFIKVGARCWWLMPVVLATQEAWSQPGPAVHKTLSWKKTLTKKGWRAGGIAQGVGLEIKSQYCYIYISSNPSTGIYIRVPLYIYIYIRILLLYCMNFLYWIKNTRITFIGDLIFFKFSWLNELLDGSDI